MLVSPSVEKFLGGRAEELRGRRVSEIFPAGHPLRGALRIEGDQIESVEGAEVTLERGAGQLANRRQRAGDPRARQAHGNAL